MRSSLSAMVLGLDAGRAEPWAGQRFMLIKARGANLPASGQQIVAGRVKEFLASRRIGLPGEDQKAFCEAARDAIDGALADLQRRHRGDLSESKVLASYPAPRPEAPRGRPKVTITGLIETWAKSREDVRQRTRDEFARRLCQFSEFIGHDDAEAVTGKDLRRWRDHLKGTLKAKTINESCVAPVKAIFAAAEAEEVLRSNPLAGLKASDFGDIPEGGPDFANGRLRGVSIEVCNRKVPRDIVDPSHMA
jgi:hypothetical protein